MELHILGHNQHRLLYASLGSLYMTLELHLLSVGRDEELAFLIEF